MVLLHTWQCCMAETVKRKSRKSSSASSTDDNLSPDGKKLRERAGRRIGFCEHGMRSFKEKFDKLKYEINPLRDKKLYMEVYQRRENLRFFGIKKKADTEEEAREVLVGFLKTGLGIENADQIEFQRVHRVGKRVSSNGKPRQIIARFLKYSQREDVQC